MNIKQNIIKRQREHEIISFQTLFICVCIYVYNFIIFSLLFSIFNTTCLGNTKMSEPLLTPVNYVGRFSILERVMSANPLRSTMLMINSPYHGPPCL